MRQAHRSCNDPGSLVRTPNGETGAQLRVPAINDCPTSPDGEFMKIHGGWSLGGRALGMKHERKAAPLGRLEQGGPQTGAPRCICSGWGLQTSQRQSELHREEGKSYGPSTA